MTCAHVDASEGCRIIQIVIGCCDSAELCTVHRKGMFDNLNLRGTAACRGEAWAEDLAQRRVLLEMRWPENSDKVLAIARRKVADLARDPDLLEDLALELAWWAERRWTAITTPLVEAG